MHAKSNLQGCLTLLCVAALYSSSDKSASQIQIERAAAEFPAAEAEAKQLGLPLAGSELMPQAPLRPEDNAAPQLLAAGKHFRLVAAALEDWKKRVTTALAQDTADQLAVAGSVLGQLDLALDSAILAAEKPRVDFGHDWTTREPWNILYLENQAFHSLSDGLALRALYRTNTGDTAGATRDYATAIYLSACLELEPTELSRRMQAAIEKKVIASMEQAMAARPFDSSFRASLQEIVAEAERSPINLIHPFKSSLIMAIVGAETPLESLIPLLWYSSDGAPPPAWHWRTGKAMLQPPGVTHTERTYALKARAFQYFNRLQAIVTSGRSGIEQIRLAETLHEEFSVLGDPTRFIMYVLTEQVSGDIGNLHSRRARLRTFLGLCAVLSYQEEYGVYPTDLAETGFKLDDPLINRPLHLKVEGETVRVYSVGPDGVDDGGEERVNTAPDAPRQMDIVSMFPRRVNAPPK